MYIKHRNLYVVSASKKNANAALVFVFLHRLVEASRLFLLSPSSPLAVAISGPWCPPNLISQVFTTYFGELEEESIRDNFVIIYELLDELMDFGYPQFTETKILQVCHLPALPLDLLTCRACRSTSRRPAASSRQRHARPWPSPMRSHGAPKTSSTGKMKCFLTLSSLSTCL